MKEFSFVLVLALTQVALASAGPLTNRFPREPNRGASTSRPNTHEPSDVPQEGETYSHKAAGLQFEIPKGWKAEPDGDNITVSTPDDSLKMVFWVPDEDTFDAAVKALDKELSKTLKNQKTIGNPIEDELNGMPHYSSGGTGEVDGTTINWRVNVLAAKKVVICLSFSAPGLWEKYADQVERFVNSIKRAE